MKDLRQVISGVLAALLSLALVLGSMSMAITEGSVLAFIPSLTSTLTSTPLPIILVSPTLSKPTATLAPGVTPSTTPIPTLTPTFTPTFLSPTPSQASDCIHPAGWTQITVQLGDTLASLAQAYHTTEDLLAQANCLVTNTLLSGTTLFVPGQPTVTPSVPCGPPLGWVYYTVQPGDTLLFIGQLFGVSVSELQEANCMGSRTLIRAGQKLFVPNRPTKTWVPTFTITVRPSDTPTSTLPPTLTPTYTPVSILRTPTFTPVHTQTSTPTPTHTSSPTPTDTLTPTPTPTLTLTPTPTSTESPTVTPTSTDTITVTVGLASYP